MKEEVFKEFKIEKVELENYNMTYKVDVNNFLNKTIIQDLKILIFYEYGKNNTLKKRNSIKVTKKIPYAPNTKLKIVIKKDDEKSNKVIGTATVIDDYNLKPENIIIKKNVIINKPHDMFELIEKHDISKYKCTNKKGTNIWDYCTGKDELKNIKYDIKDEETIKNKYISGLFKIYYDSLVYSSIINSIERIEGKASAMASYIAIKNNLDKYLNKNNFVLSNPNVFIKDINMEFDALIINKDSRNSFFFNKDEVKSLIEIKSSGFFASKEELISNKYDKNSRGAFIEYITSHERHTIEPRKKYVYFSLYESYGQRDSSIHYYEFLLANLLTLDRKKYIGVFCGLKKDSNYYLIPYEYDLDKIMKNILEH